MGTYTCNTLYFLRPKYPEINRSTKIHSFNSLGNPVSQIPRIFISYGRRFQISVAATKVEEAEKMETEREKPKFKWVEIGPEITETQKHAISEIVPKMTKRCKALMKQIICFSPEKGSLSDLSKAWVRIMKPKRADWLSVLKELRRLDHPRFIEVAEIALLEESFEANVRDYTKIIDYYGKRTRLQEAENTLLAMKNRGFEFDQVTLTTMINMYSKAGNLDMAEQTFEEIKLLGEPLDKRSYGSMIMAYIRAQMPYHGESILEEMDRKEVYAGSEVYKALLRAYSMSGDTEGAQRVFDKIQLAGISPDVKFCGLLINAYKVAGQSEKARIAFENMRKAGLEPSDKCIALMLGAYEEENRINAALELLIELERVGIMIGKEGSEILAGWFRRLGVVQEVELVLREYFARGDK